jgi:urea carboxylase-associated protein 1
MNWSQTDLITPQSTSTAIPVEVEVHMDAVVVQPGEALVQEPHSSLDTAVSDTPLQVSPRLESEASFSAIVEAGAYFLRVVEKGSFLRIVDLHGNQAVDTIYFNARDFDERYSAQDTIREQANIYLTTGTRLISTEGNAMLTIVADTCGRHDTLGGACSAESNMVRYALETRHMHACRQSFLKGAQEWSERTGQAIGKSDLAANINFFMNVPVTPEGALTFGDGISEAGKYVELRAEMDTLVLISNCPQLNNPCNAYNPTPIQVLVWTADA